MLPKDWDIRFIDGNTGDLTDADIAWADMVMTGGMPPQQFATVIASERLIGGSSTAYPSRSKLGAATLDNGRLHGDEISFTVGGVAYYGSVTGDEMRGVRPHAWRATRSGG